jgi:hypothetical protein
MFTKGVPILWGEPDKHLEVYCNNEGEGHLMLAALRFSMRPNTPARRNIFVRPIA